MKSMSQQQELYNKAMESGGALEEANAVKAESIDGKLNKLNNTMKQMWSSFIKSDMIKGAVDGLTTLIEKFGKLSTILAVVTTAFLVFKGKALLTGTKAIAGYISSLVSLVSTEGLVATATSELGVAFNSLGKVIASNPLGVVAVVLTTIIGLVNSLPTSIEKLNEISESVEKTKQSLETYQNNEKTLKQYDNLQQKIDSGKLSTEEATEAKKELVSIQKELAKQFPELVNGYNEEGDAIVTNTDKVREKIKAQKELALAELNSDYKNAQKVLNSKYTTGFWDKINLSGRPYGTDPDDKRLNEISSQDNNVNTSAIEEYQYYLELKKEGIQLNDKQTERYEGLEKVVLEYSNIVQQIYNTTKDISAVKGMKIFDTNTKELRDAVEYFKEMEQKAKGTREEIQKGLIDSWTKEIEAKYSKTTYDDSKSDFTQSIDEIEKIQKIINEIGNSKKFDDNTLKSMVEMFPELANHLDDVSYCIDFMNEKIKGHGEEQKTAYQNMMENSEDYFKTNIKDTEQWKNFTDSCYQLLENSDNDYYKQVASDMQNNFNNCKSLAEAKKDVELACIKILANAWTEYYKTIYDINQQQEDKMKEKLEEAGVKDGVAVSGDYIAYGSDAYDKHVNGGTAYGAEGSTTTGTAGERNNAGKKVSDAYSQYADELNKKLKELEDGFNVDMPDFIGTIGSNITDNKDSSKSKEKDYSVEDVEDLTDAYHDLNNAITLVEAKLKQLQARYENLYGKSKAQAMQEQVDILRQQLDLHSQMESKINSELAKQRSELASQGVTFDSSGMISNYNEILTSLRNQANAIQTVDENSKKAKENAKTNLTDLQKKMNDYNSTITKDLEEQKTTWLELQNQIKETYKTMEKMVTDGESKVTDVIKSEIDKRKEKEKEAVEEELKQIDKVKEALQDQWDTDDYEDQLQEAQDKVMEYEEKIREAIKNGDMNSLTDLKKEQQDALKELNDTVKQHERDMINDEIDDQSDALNKKSEEIDKKYEEMEKSENLTKMVTEALQTGFFKINDEVISLSSAMSDFVKESTVGIGTINQTTRELNQTLADTLAMLNQLGGYNGLTNLLPNVPYQMLANNTGTIDRNTVFTDSGNNTRSISIKLGDMYVNGNLDNVTLEDVNNTISKRFKEVVGNYIS